jgi:REP element-mobilizing transposase RayT
MSLPRQIIPGTTYLINRRCSQRQFLLNPTGRVNRIFEYCLGVAAQRTGVLVHAGCMMSNHYHLVVTDPEGRLPEFLMWLHEFVAKSLNAEYGRWENFWSSEQTNCVVLVDPAAVLEKIVYTLNNPVAAGLVSHGRQWPGLRFYTPGPRRIERPSGFFRECGPTPEVVTLDVVPSPLGAVSAHQAIARIEDAVAAAEAEVRALRRRAGKRFLGRKAICAQRWTDRPHTEEPRRGIVPRIASRNKWRRIEALQRSKQFVVDHRVASRRWRSGQLDTIFPPGTYLMRVRFGVAVAPS